MKRVYIDKSRIEGRGLFADEDIKKGDKVEVESIEGMTLKVRKMERS